MVREEGPLDVLEREKEAVIKIYWEKADKLKKEILVLEEKLKKAEELFKQDFKERLLGLERRESMLIPKEDALNKRHATILGEKTDLDNDKALFKKAQKDFEKEMAEKTEKNEALLSEVTVQRAGSAHIFEENKKVLQEINDSNKKLEALGAALIGDEKTIKEQRKNLQDLENSLKERAEKLDQRAKVLAEKEKSLAIAEAQLAVTQKTIEKATQNAKDAAFEAQEKAEKTEKLIEELNFKLAQELSEREKNTVDRIANLAREKKNSEKERILNEREQNIKLLEAKVK